MATDGADALLLSGFIPNAGATVLTDESDAVLAAWTREAGFTVALGHARTGHVTNASVEALALAEIEGSFAAVAGVVGRTGAAE